MPSVYAVFCYSTDFITPGGISLEGPDARLFTVLYIRFITPKAPRISFIALSNLFADRS